MTSVNNAKSMAKALETTLRAKNVDISHGECLDIVARQFGLKDWNVLSAQAKSVDASESRRAKELKVWEFRTAILMFMTTVQTNKQASHMDRPRSFG